MKPIAFVLFVCAILTFLLGQSKAQAAPVTLSITWANPKASQNGLTRATGDAGFWTFQVELAPNLELTKGPVWSLPGRNGIDPDWGAWTANGPFAYQWSAPGTGGTFAVSVSGRIRQKVDPALLGKYHATVDPPEEDFEATWQGQVVDPNAMLDIQINNSADEKDDLVRVGNQTSCQARALNNNAITIVLKNPDGRLRFGAADTTQTIALPADGTWIPFTIKGVTRSNAVQDAVIEAHKDTPDGDIVRQAYVSVWDLTDPSIVAKPNAALRIIGTRLAADDTADPDKKVITITGQATLKPLGLNLSAPQLANLKLNILQNVVNQKFSNSTLYSPPVVLQWLPGAAANTPYNVPSLELDAKQNPQVNTNTLDLAPDSVLTTPFNDYPVSLSNTGPTVMKIGDSPSAGLRSPRIVDWGPVNGPPVVRVQYPTIAKATYHNEFLDWLTEVHYAPRPAGSSNAPMGEPLEIAASYVIAQTGWSLDVNTDNPPPWLATGGGSGPVTITPVLDPTILQATVRSQSLTPPTTRFVSPP